MGSALLNPIAGELESVGSKPTAQTLARRAGQRRQMLVVQAVSYSLITSILLVDRVFCRAVRIPFQ
jgi:hypothetical protein